MYLLFVVFSLIFAVAYAALMRLYLYGWRLLPEQQVEVNASPTLRMTVVIPARNEALHIRACLESILNGSYPIDLLDIIVIDDDSEDHTGNIVETIAQAFPQVRLFKLPNELETGTKLNSHKKKALELAISQAKGDRIVTTDADCVVPRDWLLRHFSAAKQGALVAGPVVFYKENNLLQRFQSLDFLGMMGITGAGIQLGFQRMGNGANLSYPKALFLELGGFEGNADRASGDDMFFIQKVAAKYPDRIVYLKHAEAAVFTEAKPDWRGFVEQRIRWGTKNTALPEWTVKAALGAVFLFCWSLLINVLALFIGLFLFGINADFYLVWAALCVFQIAVKALSDYFFLRELCRYFRRTDLLRYFWPSFLIHTAYIALIGTASLFFKTYSWKGRKVR